MSTVGWIGLGAMGLPMATCLASQGVKVQIYDVYPPSVEKGVKGGCVACETPALAAKGVPILGLMVVNVMQVEDLLLGEGQVAQALPNDAVIVVFSTCPPSAMGAIQERLDLLKKGLQIVDSPVSGGSTRAGTGTLAIMSSGPPAAVEKARPMIERLTQAPEGGLSIVGSQLGAASDFKLINQVYCAIQICVTGESMAFAKSLGLDPWLVYKVIQSSSGASFMFGHRIPWQLHDDGVLHSAMTIIAKDVGIVMDEARLHTFPAPMCSVAEQIFTAALGAGMAREDDGLIVNMYKHFGVPDTNTFKPAPPLNPVAPEGWKPRVLFLGLGTMGAPMAAILATSGLEVVGYDVNLEAMDRFSKVGGKVTSDPAVEAKNAQVVVIATVTALQAEAAIRGILDSLQEGTTVIVSSTIAPGDAARLQSLLGKKALLVDAPMAGGPTKAAAGDLAIMASGEDAALSKAAPVLQAMAKNSAKLHFIPGGVGSGSKMKLVNNLLASIHLCAAAEATAFAQKKGMDLKAVYDVVSKGAASSFIMIDRMPRILAKNPPVHSAVTTFIKDLNLVIAEAKKASCPVFLASAAQQQYIRAAAHGWGAEDDSAVSRLWEFMGVDVRGHVSLS